MISNKLRAIATPGTAIVLSILLLMAGKLPVGSSPSRGALLPGQNNESAELLEKPVEGAIETKTELHNQMVANGSWEKSISFLDIHPEMLYVLLVFMILLLSLGTLGIWLVLFKLRTVKEPQKIEVAPLTLEMLNEFKNLFVETQNTLLLLQDYLENAENRSQSSSTSDWSSLSRNIRDSEVFEPDTSNGLPDRTKHSSLGAQSQEMSSSMRANELLEQGNALLVQGRYEGAIAAYEQSIGLEPNCGQVWLNRGCALFYLKEYEQAISSYDEALHRGGDLADAWYNRAGALAKLHQYEQAIACYERATQLEPDYLAPWHGRGLALVRLQRYSEALTCFKQAIQLKPNSPEFRVDLGRTLTQLHQYDQAIAAYDQAINLNPKYAPAWTHKGATLAAWERYSEAIAAYDQAVKLDPNQATIWNYLAIALAELQKYDEALAAYDQALKLKPNWPMVQNNRAALLIKLQRYPEAIAACNQALALKPEEPAIWYNKACCYSIQGNIDRAIENLQKAILGDLPTYLTLAKTDPDFDPIRQDPRFQHTIQQQLETSAKK